MPLSDIIRRGVAIANRVTSGAQCDVKLEQWKRTEKSGSYLYGPAMFWPALVTFEQRAVRTADDKDVMQVAKVDFIQPITPFGNVDDLGQHITRREPVDPRDRITLPNGYSGPILTVGGPVDPLTGQPYLVSLTLG